jgi:hypothetical protein
VPLIVLAVSFCMVGVHLFNNLPLTCMLSPPAVAPEAPWRFPGSNCVPRLEFILILHIAIYGFDSGPWGRRSPNIPYSREHPCGVIIIIIIIIIPVKYYTRWPVIFSYFSPIWKVCL